MLNSCARASLRSLGLRSRKSAALLAMAVAGASAGQANAQLWTWVNPNSGTQNWSTPTNWTPLGPPVGSITTMLTFDNLLQNTAYTANNDLGAFTLNMLTLNNQAGVSPLTISGGALTFDGAAPMLTNVGGGPSTVSTGLVLNQPLTIAGGGNGTMNISGAISGANGITISTTGAGVVNLSGGNSFVGNVNLTSGILGLAGTQALGAAANQLVVNGGQLRFSTSLNTIANPVLLNSDLVISGPAVTAGTFNVVMSGVVSGPGGINVRTSTGGSTLNFSAANTFAGDYNNNPQGNAVLVTHLSGANGAFLNVNSVSVFGNDSLTIDNSVTINPNRVNDSAPINLHRGNVNLHGGASGTTSETLGAVNMDGHASFTLTPNTGQNTQLTVASLNRVNRGTFQFTPGGSGSAGITPAANVANIFSTLAPALVGGGGGIGSTNVSIIPWGHSFQTNVAAAATLVSYDATIGVRSLTSGEYANNLYTNRGTSTTNNFRVTNQASMGETTTINALVLDNIGTFNSGLYGNGTLRVTSGAVLVAGTTAAPTNIPAVLGMNTVDFGPAEGIIYATSNTLVLSNLTGSGGLTKAGFASLILNGNNQITGGLTVNSGIVHFSDDSNLGAPGEPLFLGGGITSSLTWTPSNISGNSTATAIIINRAVNLGPAGSQVTVSYSNTTETLSGIIAGTGYLFKNGTGVLRLTNANTYTGPTNLFSGIVEISDDSNLGAGGQLNAISGHLRMAPGANVTLNRPVQVQAAAGGTAFIVPAGTSLTFAQPISNEQVGTGTPVFVTSGPGLITMTANNPYSAAVQLGTTAVLADQPAAMTGGALVLSGAGALASASNYTALQNTSIVLDNLATNNNNRLSTSTLSLAGANLIQNGNGGVPSIENIGTLVIGTGGMSAVSVFPGAGQNAQVVSTGLQRNNGGMMLFRGPALGDPAGPGVSNVQFATAPTLISGIIVGALGDLAPAGNGTGFVTNDVNGVRLLTPGEYTPMPVTGATTFNADVLGPTLLVGPTTVNSMRIGTGGSIDIGLNTLSVTTGMILGTDTTSITNGDLAMPVGGALIVNNAPMDISARLTGSGTFTKGGVGVLTLSNGGNSMGTTAYVLGGVLRYGNATAIPAATALVIQPGAQGITTVDLNGFSISLASISGYGEVNINGGTLALSGASTAYQGALSGAGSLVRTGTGITTLAGASTFTGDVYVRGGGLTIQNSNALGTGVTPVNLDNSISGTVALLIGANVQSFSRDLNVTGTAGTVTFGYTSGSNVNYTGNIATSRTLRLLGGGGTALPSLNGAMTYTGVISGAGALDIFGGSHNLYGVNTYTGGTTLDSFNSTVVGVNNNSSLGTGQVFFTSFGSTLRADAAGLVLPNDFRAVGGAFIGFTGTNGMTIGGNFNADVGSINVAVTSLAPLTVTGQLQGGLGTLNKQGGGELVLSDTAPYLGRLNANGGVLSFRTTTNTATLAVNSGAVIRIPEGNPTTPVVLRVRETGTLLVNSGGVVDVTTNALVLDYPTGASPVANTQTLVITGYNGGDWKGRTSITSSTAADVTEALTNRAVGYGEATDIFSSFPANFLGQSIDDSTVLVRYTVAGDATLDGTVNSADFNILATNFGTSGKRWTQGDFSYDTSVNSGDFNILATNFGTSLPSSGGPGAAVPEPAAVGAMIVASAGLLLRRRKR